MVLLPVVLITACLLIPGPATAQWDWIVDDFSNDRLSEFNTQNLHRGGKGYITNGQNVIIPTPQDWWYEVIAKGNKCQDLSGKALAIYYSAYEAGNRVLQFYQQKSSIGQEIKVNSIDIMLYKQTNVIIVPMTAFQKASVSCGYAFVLKGPIVLSKMELIEEWEAHSNRIPFAHLWYPPAASIDPESTDSPRIHIWPRLSFFGYPVYEQFLGNLRRGLYLEDRPNSIMAIKNMHECMDLRGKSIRITYTLNLGRVYEMLNVYVVYKLFICENSHMGEASAKVTFVSGAYQHVDVPARLFLGSDLTLLVKVRVSGPLTVHQFSFVDDPVATVPSLPDINQPVETSQVKLIDDFTTRRPLPNQLQVQRSGSFTLDTQNHFIRLDQATNSLTETFDFGLLLSEADNKSIKITYSAFETNAINVVMLQRSEKPIRKRRRGKWDTLLDFSANVMFMAGAKQIITIPVSEFSNSGHTLDAAMVTGISIHGPLTVHRLELVDDVLPEIPPTDSPVASKALIGIPTTIADLSKKSLNEIAFMYKHGELSRGARYHVGEIELARKEDYLLTDICTSQHVLDLATTAFRITYSSPKTGLRKLSLTPEYPHSAKIGAMVTFTRGTHKQIVIPLTTWRLHLPYAKLMIRGGPMSIHQIELVTTTQVGTTAGTAPVVVVKPTLTVIRDNLFMDAYHQVSALSPTESQYSFSVRFFGEDGSDNGGLSREFFTLISREFAMQSRGLFMSSPNGLLLQIDPNSVTLQNCTSVFRFVGRIMGLAYMHSYLLDLDFAPSFYKMIFNEQVSINDLQQTEPVIYGSFATMIKDESYNEAGLTMSAEYPLSSGMATVEFDQNGGHTPVSKDNVHDFIARYSKWRIYSLVKPQILAIRQGIKDVVPYYRLIEIGPTEFSAQITGIADIDINDWRSHTHLDGYVESDITIQLFWQCVSEWTPAERRDLLQFVTGSGRVPDGGFQSFGPAQFTIFRSSPDRFPSTHTCALQLDLPPFTCLQELKTKLKFAMNESRFMNV